MRVGTVIIEKDGPKVVAMIVNGEVIKEPLVDYISRTVLLNTKGSLEQ